MRAERVIKARRTGTCHICHQLVKIGDQIGKTPVGWCHVGCIIDRALTLEMSLPLPTVGRLAVDGERNGRQDMFGVR